jgi:rhodanese-related sulfurtransferase
MEKSFSERVEEAKQVISSLSPQEAATLKESNDVVFVDPRTALAIAETTGIITGARNIQLHDISGGNLPADLDKTSTHVITSCQGGPMGAVAAHEFRKRGFANVNYVDGGTQGWLNAGFHTSR